MTGNWNSSYNSTRSPNVLPLLRHHLHREEGSNELRTFLSVRKEVNMENPTKQHFCFHVLFSSRTKFLLPFFLSSLQPRGFLSSLSLHTPRNIFFSENLHTHTHAHTQFCYLLSLFSFFVSFYSNYFFGFGSGRFIPALSRCTLLSGSFSISSLSCFCCFLCMQQFLKKREID